MTISFSLAHLTVIGLSPPEVVRVAARAGYRTVGLRLIRVTETSPGYALMRDPKMMSATKSAVTETGVGVLDIEFVRITPDIVARFRDSDQAKSYGPVSGERCDPHNLRRRKTDHRQVG